MPDFANMNYEMVDGDGLTVSDSEIDAPTDTSDNSYYDDECGDDMESIPWWMDLSSSVLDDYYFDDDTEGAPSGSDGDSDSWVDPDDYHKYHASEYDGGYSTTENWTTEDDEEWYSMTETWTTEGDE